MGTFTQSITLLSDSSDRREDIEALVDTGATFSSAPAPVLERLGVSPERTVRLRLANDQIEERQLGFVKARIDGQESYIPCVFANEDEPAVIGAITLEVFLLAIDPVEKRLVPTTGLWV